MKVISVVGARPNFMKIAPFVQAIERANKHGMAIRHSMMHTGQHYDTRMSQAFFDALGIPEPDIHLGVGSGTHAEQVGRTMIAFEKVLWEVRPDWVVVVGDVNATCACSITAKKEGVGVAHIEAGLRSFDLAMPEEINRMVTDRLSDLLFTTDALGSENLRREGVPEERIHLVGNVMIDTLLAQRERAASLDLNDVISTNLLSTSKAVRTLSSGEPFAVLTLHRPSNVDDATVIGPLIDYLVCELADEMILVWPIHPRTRSRLESFGLWERVASHPRVVPLEPVGYHEMLRLNMSARVLLTDSGGLQEECCVLGTPCLTLRWNTERPITLREHGGVSELVGNDVARLRAAWRRAVEMPFLRQGTAPPLWDGHAAERIVDILARNGAQR